MRNKVIGVYDKGKAGSVVETEQSIVDKETGDVYSKTVSTAFFVGQGNWAGPKGLFSLCLLYSIDGSFVVALVKFLLIPTLFFSGPSSVSYAPPQGEKPDAIHIVQTNLETAHLYR